MTDLTLKEALVDLRRPFTPAAVKFKIQVSPTSDRAPAIIVAFIDSRLVAERLNHVVGGDWSDQMGGLNAQHGGAFLTCRLTVLGSTREDVGWSVGAAKDMDVKAVYSDAFKRAAVKFGIGSFLYAMPTIKLWPNDLESYQAGGKTKYKLPDAAVVGLTERFAAWAAHKKNVDRFGSPIDHGDALPPAPSPAPSSPAQAQMPGVPAPIPDGPREGVSA